MVPDGGAPDVNVPGGARRWTGPVSRPAWELHRACRDRRGKLRLAQGGMLFLDEVGEMRLGMQALFMRFLENGEIQAVGPINQKRASTSVSSPPPT